MEDRLEDRQKLFIKFALDCMKLGQIRDQLEVAEAKLLELDGHTDEESVSLWVQTQRKVYELTIEADKLDAKINKFMLDELNSD